MLKLRCCIKAKKPKLARWTCTATCGFYSWHLFAAEVIPYPEQWKRVTTIESYNCDWFVVSGGFLADSGSYSWSRLLCCDPSLQCMLMYHCSQHQSGLLLDSSVIHTGNFRGVQTFAFFEGRAVNAKIKTRISSHALVFHMQSYWWVWFPGIEPRTFLLKALELEPNKENLPLYGTTCTALYHSWFHVTSRRCAL